MRRRRHTPASPGSESHGTTTATKSPPASPANEPHTTATAPKPPSGPLAKLERSMLFFPVRYPSGNWHPDGLDFEDAWFQAADGTKLHGWYVPHAKPKATVLYCHGNGGNVAYWAGAAKELHDRAGVSVLLFDYRGYGRSEGEPYEAGVLADARAARSWLARREGIAEGQIVLLGRSLGGAVAVDLAATDGARAWCWRALSPRFPTWPKACIRSCRFACWPNPTQFGRQDRQLPRPLAAKPRHGRSAHPLFHRPKAVRSGERAQTVRPPRRPRPQRPAERRVLRKFWLHSLIG